MKNEKKLTESLEKYLKAVHFLVLKNKAARVKDVANFLNIGPSSVSEALRTLADKEYINYQPYGIITLTDKGEEYAVQISQRHNIISNFLEDVLLIDSDKVNESAQKIAFSIPEEVLTKFVCFLEFMQTCSCKEPKWMKSYKYYADEGGLKSTCKKCIDKCACQTGGPSSDNCCGGCS